MNLKLSVLVVLLTLSNSAAGYDPSPTPTPQIIATPTPQPRAADDEVLVIMRRYGDPKHINMLQGAMWGVTHDYKDLKHVHEVIACLARFMQAMGTHAGGNAAPLEQLGGVKAFRQEIALWLDDGDQAVRALGAIVAGIIGGRDSVPQLLKLMTRNDAGKDTSRVYDKARAAVGLGLIGAIEHKPDIALLLKSENPYDRMGAVDALSLLGAKEYAKEVAGLMNDPEARLSGAEGPISFLVESGAAKDYKKELITAMHRPFGGETAKAAMYALVRVNAKEDAAEIAKLLTDRYQKGDAAKALALLGATEYTDKIAVMLDNDEEKLAQCDAALALGILGSKKYAPKLAALMVDKTSFVNTYAAAAIIMMDATMYRAEASRILARSRAQGVFLTASSFHPLVSAQAAPFIEKVKAAK